MMENCGGNAIVQWYSRYPDGDGHDVESQRPISTTAYAAFHHHCALFLSPLARDCIQTRSHPVYGPLLTVAENRLLAVQPVLSLMRMCCEQDFCE
eukprot:588637-Amphidinium_carterae.1